jgi:prefoldin subunit 5
VNQFKIQLSKKEERLKELTGQLSGLTDRLIERNTQLEELQKERDHLKFKNEILTEHCSRNNITVELPSDNTLSLIDEYKSKIEQLHKQLEQKVQENKERQGKVDELLKNKAKDDKLLQHYNEEI